MKTFLLAFLLFCCGAAGAQDYVVTLKSDTLRGKAQIMTYDRMDRVDIAVNKKKSHFTCIQVKTVSINSETYHPVRTETGYRFMKLQIPGFLSLYLARRENGFLYEIETFVKRDGSSLEVPGISFKKILSNYLEDCQEVADKIKTDVLTRKDVVEILNQYNSCVDTRTLATITANSYKAAIDPLITSLNELKTKVEKNSSVVQKDALDILKDITSKVTAAQTVPNYLLEGFKESVKNSPELLADFDKITAMIKK
ncbi:hypothetical protein BH09BAC3_BH09BAC3_14540 [soil metagenome]